MSTDNKPVKILIALPDGRIHKLKLFGMHSISFREAPLTLPVLASLVPEELNVHITTVDESVQSIPFDKNFDLVAISCLTGTSKRAYEIARYFRSKGSTIVLGGIHATLLPSEAMEHADAVVSGYGEDVWPQLLRDYVNGSLRIHYHGDEVNLKNYPFPNPKWLNRLSYMNPNVTFATRGCKSTCDFCSVPAAGLSWNTRPVGEVIEHIKSFRGSRFTFNDVSLLEDREYAKELFTALIPLKKKWGGLCTSLIAEDDEMLDLMARSGCIFLLIGLESVNPNTLKTMHKGFNKPNNYKYLVDKLHAKSIIVMGCFIFGSDDDDLSVFERTVDMVNQAKIDIPRYAIYTPYPGTEAYNRLLKEGRLLHKHWEHYDTQHVVFQPKNMTPQQLDEGFRWAYQKTFKINSIYSRTVSLRNRFPFTFMGNLAYRIYLKRLENERERIYFE
ncbi:MAG: B12-binding domain-containing radical SAM protein [Bacteroidales bacterium]